MLEEVDAPSDLLKDFGPKDFLKNFNIRDCPEDFGLRDFPEDFDPRDCPEDFDLKDCRKSFLSATGFHQLFNSSNVTRLFLLTASHTRCPSALDSSYLRLKEYGDGLLETPSPKPNAKSPELLRGCIVISSSTIKLQRLKLAWMTATLRISSPWA